ncbi:putative lipid II flippase FtsW [Wenzhouxiangella marina]|uniref:Probable peptidoglycan glycosyltransferase FtsW n=1 Tax=Wenzhouxiangella marina TaxID=1579979 RepID=A0A0K0XYG9_9GAMM|nr:putative lipid II flippase FtsW [Wenzhouxiangella marina]AKS42728.1 cell division protein FtsW [Wenzhouxiangella marina]MBB6088582.1 cell division protein FtsW [Wenzhouxiangella marina]
MTARTSAKHRQASRWGEMPRTVGLDPVIVITASLLLSIGLIMVASTSMAVAENFSVGPWHFVQRHLMFIGVALVASLSFRFIGTPQLELLARACLPAAVLILMLPFIPGLGHEVNGATRWINLGVTRFQVVEVVKLMLIIHVAGYLSRRPELNRARFIDTIKPLAAVGLMAAILLMQPDMGSAVVLVAIVAGMIWLAGAAWKHLFLLGSAAIPLFGFAAMEPYRLRRVMSFVDPWADPYSGGFQLIQALIAVGRGQIGGVGLGSSVQKLYYLPEAHTDFIFAVLAEELGLVGIVLVLGLFVLLVGQMFRIGLKALTMERAFSAFVVWGIALWIGLQALVSIGVNLGVLPTKGLTLPLVSAGGSSLIMTIAAIALVLRIDWELKRVELERPRRRRGGWSV